MEKVKIDENTKGVLVFAKRDYRSDNDWIILISHVERNPWDGSLSVKRHISYDVSYKCSYANDKPGSWGNPYGFTFYKPTEEHKKIIAQELRKHGYKYISVLNKLIKVNDTGR